MSRKLSGFITVLFTIITLAIMPASAMAQAGDAETAWRLLDYIAIDYPGAVADGAVIDKAEYAEQVEFAATAANKIASLEQKPERAALLRETDQLKQAIASKESPERVARIAQKLATDLLAAYPVPLAPSEAPSMDRGAQLYKENCASCHGATGNGRGPASAGLDPAPTAFTDKARARERSLFALYQVITQGLDDTPMRSFSELSSKDRWALAFYVGQLAYTDADAVNGEALWQRDTADKNAIPDLKALASTTPAALEQQIGKDNANALMAYLRLHPDELTRQTTGRLTVARERLAESLAAYRTGDRKKAASLALSSYLDGFETVEPALRARNSSLVAQVENEMIQYRAAIQKGESADKLAERAQTLDGLLQQAESTLSEGASSAISTFVGAATILLREGLEALLIVVAIIAFLRKAKRTEVTSYVHAGWIIALVAGFATWLAATWLIDISGASRELTEGFGSVFAALVLLSVGIWMHGKSHADQWQRYIQEKMSKALSGRSAVMLFILTFVVVYREVFETILFYAALWAQGNHGAILTGAISACVALAIIAWALLHYSQSMPIGTFFRYSAWLMAILTVVLIGKGAGALQEAGMIGVTPLTWVPRVEILGLLPTMQTVVAQVLMIIALVIGFQYNQRKAAPSS